MSGVVHIITALEQGGAQRVALDTAARLNRPDRPQWLVTGTRAALLQEAAQRLGDRLLTVQALDRPIRPLHDARALIEIHRCLRGLRESAKGPLVVHTHSSKAGVLGRLAVRGIRGCRVVHSVHGFGFEAVDQRYRWIARAAERIAGGRTDALVFVSEADRRLARRLGLAPRADFYIIRAGIDPAPFAALKHGSMLGEQARQRWKIPSGASLVVSVANCKPQKDPLFHIDILTALLGMVPGARLLFVGDGPLRAAAVEHATRRRVAERVLLPGFLEDVRPVYAAADAYLLASRWEGLPMSVLEALASGLPAVVRDTGWAADLSWARGLYAVQRHAPAEAFAAVVQQALQKRRYSPSTADGMNGQIQPLPPAFTQREMLRQLDGLYDGLLSSSDERPRASRTICV